VGDVTRKRSFALATLAAAAATAALFWISRGKWSDPLIDSGREWIVPDTLAGGGLLYRDVVYWFGPFTPYFQAAFLRLFGSGFGPLVVSGALAGAVVVALLHVVLRRVTLRREAALWTAIAVPSLLFMPDAGGVFLGMGYRIWHAAAFALAAVAAASAPAARPYAAAALAGAAAGLAGLCRTEWGLATAAAVVLALAVRRRRRAPTLLAASVAGYAAVFGAGIALFLWKAGPRSVVSDGHVLLTGLPAETRHFLVAFSGVGDWKSGALELAYSAAMWTGLFVVVAVVTARAESRRAALRVLAAALLVLGVTAALGGAGSAVLFSAAPAICALGLALGLARGRGSGAAALAGSGFLGLLLSYRRPFHIGDSAYVGPPLLFALVCAAGILQRVSARVARRDARARLRGAWRWVLAALAAFAFLGRAAGYAAFEGRPIEGTSEMLFARPELASEIEQLGRAIRERTPSAGTLAVFPEGEILNLLSQRANPIRHKLYLPGYLTDGNEPDVLDELARDPPDAIVIWRRPTTEYDRAMFGLDYGRRIRGWIDGEYTLQPYRAAGAPARSNPRFLLGTRRPAGSPAPTR